MKVVLIGSKAFDSLEYHLGDSLRALGHEALTLNVADVLPLPTKVNYWAARFVESYDRLACGQLARKVVVQRPDLILVVYRHLHPVLVDQIKKKLPGIPVAQLNPDALTNLEKGQIIAADFDYYFSKEPFLVDCLRNKAGLNAYYLPEGFNQRIHVKPSIEKVVAERQTNIDVLVYGGLYAYRSRMVEQLIRAGLQVVVYGTVGSYLRPAVRSVFQNQYIVGAEKNQLLYGAKVVFNNFHYAEINSVNQKYFESNGVGAFQLCDYKPTVDEYTGVPAEWVTYQTMSEAIDKIQYYLARPDERYELANRQYVHFQQHHTFDQRVAQLLKTVGLQVSTPQLAAI